MMTLKNYLPPKMVEKDRKKGIKKKSEPPSFTHSSTLIVSAEISPFLLSYI